MENPSISVVYLCWLPYGLDCFKTFINSFKQFDAGVAHQLVIVFKGSQNQDDELPFIEILQLHDLSFKTLYYTGDELDISTYYWAASQLTTKFVFFLNSRSEILISNWLMHFYQATQDYPRTVFCATGSWQSYISSVFKQYYKVYDKTQSFNKNFTKYRLLLKAATLWWYYFPLFPNPHIRTNAFFIERDLFLSLTVKKIISKIDAYRFESGRKGFTRQLKTVGYNVALIAASGEIHFKESWPLSSIFWKNEQKNLMIADNQTEAYINSNDADKKFLETLAWG